MLELTLVLLWTGGLLWLLAAGATAWVLMRPTRLTPARAMARIGRMSPADIGLRRFQECEFHVADPRNRKRLRIVGWWIDAEAQCEQTVLVVHGYADSRAGALAWAPVWRAAGCNLLLIDLRGHGESGGTFTTAGLREREDIAQIVNEIRSSRPAEAAKLLLFGVSMGASIVLAAAERCEVDGVVIDSPVASFDHGALTQSWLMGLAGPIVIRPALALTQLVLGEKFDAIRPVDVIRRLNTPVLAMLPCEDPFLPPAATKELEEVVAARRKIDGISRSLRFEGALHLLPLQSNATMYAKALIEFCRTCKADGLARGSAGAAVARREFGPSHVDP